MSMDDVRMVDGYDDPSAEGAPVTFTRSQPTPDVFILEIRGDLDIAVSGALGRELDELLRLAIGRVDVDLSGVMFIDSSALSALVQANERAQRAGQRFNIVRPSPACTKVLSITGLDRVFGLT